MRNLLTRYGAAVLLVLMAFGLRLALAPILGDRSPFLLFTLAVLIAGGVWGVGPGILATLLSLLLGSWAFLPPYFDLLPLTSDATANIAAFAGTSIATLIFAHYLVRSREREAASLAARHSVEQREQRMLDAVQDYAIFEIDPEGRVLTWNSGAERMKGWTAEEIIGLPLDVLHTPEQRAANQPSEELRIAAECGRFRDEGVRLRKDGTTFMADVNLFPLWADDNVLTGFVKVTRDITERKEAEEKVRRLNDSLEAQVEARTRELKEANEELDAFTYTVSHDLRAPLRAMEGFSRILLDEHGQQMDEEGRRFAGRIVGAATRMEGLIDDLLAYSRLTRDNLPLQRVEVDRVVERCVEEVAATAAPEPPIFRIDAPLPMVLAEPLVLQQVLCNLINNAVKFRAPDQATEVTVRAESHAGRVRIWVEDNGIGIDPKHRDRIFRIFERLHGQETYPGTGVGLAIVRKGVERMGGTCGVESTPGLGSRFWVELAEGKAA